MRTGGGVEMKGKKVPPTHKKSQLQWNLDESHISVSKATGCKVHFYHGLILLTSSDVWIPQTSCELRENHKAGVANSALI